MSNSGLDIFGLPVAQENPTPKAWNVPIPSSKELMTNKSVDYQLLSEILLNSYFGGRENNMDTRYIYKVKLWDNQLEVTDENENVIEVVELRDGDKKLPLIANKLGMSLSTFKRKLNALLKTDLGLFEIGMNESGAVFYNINYAKDGKYYITIPSDILEKLVITANTNMIKLYVLLTYHLTEPVLNPDGTFKELKYIRKQMTYDFMMEQIGLSAKTNRKIVLTMLEDLCHKGLLRAYEITTPIQTVDKKTNKIITMSVKGYEYSLTTYNEWVEHCNMTK